MNDRIVNIITTTMVTFYFVSLVVIYIIFK